MKTIVLIGDSIRMGYQSRVCELLTSRMQVWGPEQNGGTSANVLAHLGEWAVAHRPEVLHINCGLHDLKKEFGSPEAAIPLNRYRDNLREILNRVKAETDAAVVWALTTPVNHEWHHRNKTFDRFEEDVRAYNDVAADICRDFGVRVNDLFSVVMSAGRDDLLLPDGVHYKPEGYALLGRTVADCIRKVLSDMEPGHTDRP